MRPIPGWISRTVRLWRRPPTVAGGAFSRAAMSVCRGLALWLADEQERWLLWAPVAVGLGVYLYFAGTDEPALLTVLGPSVLAAIGLATMWRRPALRFPALLLLLCAIGYAAGAVRTNTVSMRRSSAGRSGP